MKKKLLGSIAALAITTAVTTAFIPSIGKNVFALNQSIDYTTQFYCRTVINDEVQYLTYSGGNNLEITDNKADALFTINFTSNNTITIDRGDYHLGYKNTDDTSLKNTASTWDLYDGLLKQHEGTRTLLFSISNSCGRAYSGKVGEAYLPIYFYTDQELEIISHRCETIWDSDREIQLQNLSYNINESAPAIKYNIELNANGGEGTKTIQVKAGSYTLPTGEGFTKDGYDFIGWSKTTDGSKIETESIEVLNDIILYAVWEEHIRPVEEWINATMNAGTNASDCTVNGNNGIKVGTSKVGGAMSITLSTAGKTLLRICVAGWNGESKTVNVTIDSGTITPASFTTVADSGIQGSRSSFTLSGDIHTQDFILFGYTAGAIVTLTAQNAKNRFVVWNAQYK